MPGASAALGTDTYPSGNRDQPEDLENRQTTMNHLDHQTEASSGTSPPDPLQCPLKEELRIAKHLPLVTWPTFSLE